MWRDIPDEFICIELLVLCPVEDPLFLWFFESLVFTSWLYGGTIGNWTYLTEPLRLWLKFWECLCLSTGLTLCDCLLSERASKLFCDCDFITKTKFFDELIQTMVLLFILDELRLKTICNDKYKFYN